MDEDVKAQFIIIKNIVESERESIQRMSAEIHGNGKEGLKTQVIEQTADIRWIKNNMDVIFAKMDITVAKMQKACDTSEIRHKEIINEAQKYTHRAIRTTLGIPAAVVAIFTIIWLLQKILVL